MLFVNLEKEEGGTAINIVPDSCVAFGNIRIVQILKENARKILKRELITEGSGPWSDMWMFVERGIPAINFGCNGEGAHDKNECVNLKSLIATTKIYALTAFDFLKFTENNSVY